MPTENDKANSEREKVLLEKKLHAWLHPEDASVLRRLVEYVDNPNPITQIIYLLRLQREINEERESIARKKERNG